MDTEASLRDAQRSDNPLYFNPSKYGSSGIFFGPSSQFNQPYPPMYNSFFGGQPTNPNQYQQPPSFLFRERKGRVNWRNIANLDIDDLVGRGDIKALEAHLSNITFANIEREDLETFGDATLLKLFRLSQYGLEYLLNCQNYLAGQTQAMDNQYRNSQELLLPLEEQARRNQAEIVNLKSEVKQKKELLKAYQNSLSTPLFKCHLCSKFFKDQGYLNAHFKRKHAPPPQEEVILQKIVTKDTATSPAVVPKAADRYKQRYAEDEDIPRPESTAQSQQIQQSTLLFEKFMAQLKQNEGLQLSQLTSTIQDRLDEVLESNKALTAKVSELEQKLETQSMSPQKAKPVTPEKEYVGQKEFAQTGKRNYEDAATSPRGFDQTLKRGESRNESMEDLQRKITPKKLSLKDKMSTGGNVQVYHAGSLQDVKDEIVPVTKTEWYRQEFRAGSINDVVEVDEEQPNESKMFYLYPRLQVFRAGEVEDAQPEDISLVNKGVVKQLTEPGQIPERWIDVKQQIFRAGEIENARDDSQRQVFNAGDLRGDRDTFEDLGLIKSQGLEDDDDSMKVTNNRRFSQGDFVIMEQEEEEEEHGNLLEDDEGELNEDQLREKHKNLVTKASKLIINKYRGQYTAKEDEEGRKKMKKEINNLSKELYQMKYKHMDKQKKEELEDILKDLKRLNKQNYQELKYIESDRKVSQSQPRESEKVPSKKTTVSQEKGKKDAIVAKDNKVMQSGELMNLLMTQGGRESKSGSSQDPSSMRKQVFESQNLEMQLGSMEDVKKSGNLAPQNKQNVRESGSDLVKKSIEIGITEQL